MAMTLKELREKGIDLGQNVTLDVTKDKQYAEPENWDKEGIVENFDTHPEDQDLITGVMVKFTGKLKGYGLLPPEHLLPVED